MRDAVAVATATAPVIEAHLSNPGAHESFRHVSEPTPAVTATIAGPSPALAHAHARAHASEQGALTVR
ncbi:type II 3-dehydroquinate dehydratase [Streptomyces sp. 5.8]|uniref:type II 3-dehydroquinate dehydratase n=1 Tax=Streptomyces sp. 5.8 TaxID=3406571 RepID=UPI003BB71412